MKSKENYAKISDIGKSGTVIRENHCAISPFKKENAIAFHNEIDDKYCSSKDVWHDAATKHCTEPGHYEVCMKEWKPEDACK